MSEILFSKYEELIKTGNQLVPQGGFEVSGYNARVQIKYHEWRIACLELFELSGPIGFSYKQKILGAANNDLFFQSSAQLILNCVQDLYNKLKTSPELASPPNTPIIDLPISSVHHESEKPGVRILKPPIKRPTVQTISEDVIETASKTHEQSDTQISKVYVIGETDDPLHAQLLQFLHEIGLEEVNIDRTHGQMLSLESFKIDKNIGYVFFVLGPDDLTYAMFEIGHFAGNLGKNRVCVLHMSDMSFPKNIPGVMVKPIVVKLEEASFGILKDLKAAGYHINL